MVERVKIKEAFLKAGVHHKAVFLPRYLGLISFVFQAIQKLFTRLMNLCFFCSVL